MTSPKTVTEYIAAFPKETQTKLNEMRVIIKELAPEAEESISYGIAGYKLNGPLVYFGGFKEHVSLFATASQRVATKFTQDLQPYKQAKGTIQFKLEEPLPTDLIRKIVHERVLENTGR